MLTIALSKGRILKQTLPLLKKAGLEIADKELNSRKLILDTNLDEVKIIVIRAFV
jgi:ATP phosphoribosyltransferase